MTTKLDRLSQELAKLQVTVARLQLDRASDMEDIQAARAMAEFVLWTHRSVNDQELAGYGPAGSDEQLGSIEMAMGGVVQGQKPLDGDALN